MKTFERGPPSFCLRDLEETILLNGPEEVYLGSDDYDGLDGHRTRQWWVSEPSECEAVAEVVDEAQ